VLGPTTNGTKLSDAARLRKEILKKCSDFNARVLTVAAEHSQLIRAAKQLLGPRYNLCSYEIKLAQQCDLIIMLPSSAGSLVELGLFVREEWACSKSAIFFDAKFKNGKSFISEGPRRAYKLNGARIADVNYRKIDEIMFKVGKLIQEFRILKVERKRFP
jgi:hypothetical protein